MAVCRVCSHPLTVTFADLGVSPFANSYIAPERMNGVEPFYPLHVWVCESCFLVQLEELESPEHIFSDYAYFSSYSDTWLEHCRRYTEQMTGRFGLGPESQVVEIASNDGYLLQYFRDRGIPVLGVEPAANVAEVARAKGIPTLTAFFGAETARQLAADGKSADLIAGNNVLAHVPDLLSFIKGLKILLKPEGVITLEFPHLLQLIRHRQFDTIYHEHFSYLSLIAVENAFRRCGLKVFDIEELPTHGGSLRVYAAHSEYARPTSERTAALREKEGGSGLHRIDTYSGFADSIRDVKCDLLEFLIGARREGRRVAAYGAPAKGNTLLNYCGIGPEFIPYTVDRSPHKQGRYLPGVRIPIHAPEKILSDRPDYVLILPWNLRDEIAAQMNAVYGWNGRFVVAIPKLEIF